MKKKHTLVVGGTKGTGRVMVRKFAEESHRVSVIARRLPNRSDAQMPDVCHWQADVSDIDSLRGVLDEIVFKNGRVNHVIFFQRYRGEESDYWRGEFETSLTATKNVIEHLTDKFDKTGERAIVVIGSVASFLIAQEQPLSYHVAKAGLWQMVRYYAVVLGHKGIRVNSVSPAIVLKEEANEFYAKNIQLSDLYSEITPLGRMGTSEEIANVVSFLCSSKASFITGQDIIVDGGLSLQWHEGMARKLTSLNHLDITQTLRRKK